MAKIKVAQIIDNLWVGGAEVFSVNLANSLANTDWAESHLIVTRVEDQLAARIDPAVKYLFLGKKRLLDIKAIWTLYKYLRKHQIKVVHAHSTSFFYPALLKIFTGIKLVWHDHYGKEIEPSGNRDYPYKQFSPLFNRVICVSEPLLQSNRKHLRCKKENMVYMPNFSTILPKGAAPAVVPPAGKRIITVLANIRPQKDYENLLLAVKELTKTFPDLLVYCVGLITPGEYQDLIEQKIKELQLGDTVVLTGPVNNPQEYLYVAEVGVLASNSEGLPLSVIEYGLAALPVVCTAVGQCPVLLGNGAFGALVPPRHPQQLAAAIANVLQNPGQAQQKAAGFLQHINKLYGKEQYITHICSLYSGLVKT